MTIFSRKKRDSSPPPLPFSSSPPQPKNVIPEIPFFTSPILSSISYIPAIRSAAAPPSCKHVSPAAVFVTRCQIRRGVCRKKPSVSNDAGEPRAAVGLHPQNLHHLVGAASPHHLSRQRCRLCPPHRSLLCQQPHRLGPHHRSYYHAFHWYIHILFE